jgi:segregation and condensation protein B
LLSGWKALESLTYKPMMTDSPENANNSEPAPEPALGGAGWSGADIEEAYLKALQAMEDIPWAEEGTAQEAVGDNSLPSAATESVPHEAPTEDHARAETVATEPGLAPVEDAPSVSQSPENTLAAPLGDAAPPTGPRLAKGTAPREQSSPEESLNVSPAQVIEAALFVGGGPLTARKICGFLRGSYETRDIEQLIDKLNDDYFAQARPYEIRLGEGGYRLELRPEYDRLRHRVYGSGPREVRLSQEVLEVLALVAYLQPISEKDIEGHGKQNAGNLLRQLLRRDLIAFERGPGGRKDIQYHTTARFLSVFGLGSLDELPQAEDLAKK